MTFVNGAVWRGGLPDADRLDLGRGYLGPAFADRYAHLILAGGVLVAALSLVGAAGSQCSPPRGMKEDGP
ncbi:hypothetical protein OG976_00025 [Mycobacterium sp. NBC_00419]|uniref:hypothetical protein n=1 Tax=Mycobacterium sp. NBC_00419 TaxID=2975989 RepID=UPI002E212784